MTLKVDLKRPSARRARPEGGHTFGPLPSILSTIGKTPVIRLAKLAPRNVDVFAKLEAFNPMGSVKDRIAFAMIEAAERSGALKPGQTVIEATSGNTGIGLAMVCACKGYPLVIVMAESFSVERRKLLRFLGAKVVLTPAAGRGMEMFRAAEYLAEKNGWFLCRQFENQANADIHTDTTAQEILEDFEAIGLDYWVSGFGTGGTLNGVSRALKLARPETKVVVVEPENSQILNSDIVQQRREDGAATRSHPNARAHPIQGWSPDFVPKLAGDAAAANHVDVFQPVTGAEALRTTQDMARFEGIFCGISGGATVAAALKLAKSAPDGSRILAMVPDTGERYMSTPLFHQIATEMSDEEQAIADLVPARTPSASPTKSHLPISASAREFVQDAIHDQAMPVVMFGFEWCEFCWSVRRLFDDAHIPFRSIDVDSSAYRENDWGGDVLRALFDYTRLRTVPQVFVGGELVGGAVDVLQEAKDETLLGRLSNLPTPIRIRPIHDPLEYLPSWSKRPETEVVHPDKGRAQK
ncbi:MAG: pyridoxal-phosphate dependent enzyme [Pseudomonadota bacterium]